MKNGYEVTWVESDEMVEVDRRIKAIQEEIERGAFDNDTLPQEDGLLNLSKLWDRHFLGDFLTKEELQVFDTVHAPKGIKRLRHDPGWLEIIKLIQSLALAEGKDIDLLTVELLEEAIVARNDKGEI
jgi:hypothetical protein